MGGKSGSTTVGYKYYVGVHAVFCMGPIDKFTKLSWDYRSGWVGEQASSGSITVDATDLFGGDDREGGVSGTVDVMMGESTQAKNSYLLSKIGADIPAYRQVTGMVFRDFYWGNNPYLKAVRARGTRILKAQDGATQWYPEKAAVAPALATAVYNAADTWPTLTQGVDGGYPTPPSYYPATMTLGPYTVDTYVIAGSLDGLTDLHPDDFLWVDGVRIGDIAAQIIGAGTILKTLPAGNTCLLELQNTANPYSGMTGEFYVQAISTEEMNPAHIIRECLTNQDWGMGYSTADIDDTSFTAAADTLYDEACGMSLLWSKQAKIEDFIAEIIRHIDAALYVSRSSGKFVLKLIRDDYTVGSLTVLDESNIDRITQPSRPQFGELVNAVTVQFWNTLTERPDSITVQDPAAIQMQGGVIPTTLQYQGFTSVGLAQRAAARDLRSLSNPFFSCTIYTGEAARALDIGDVFVLNWAKWGLSNVVMRITGFAVAEGGSNQIRIQCVEDVFTTPLNAVLVPPAAGWTDPSQVPAAATNEIADEVPYYEIVQSQGQTQTDNLLAGNSDLGYVFAAAGRPTYAINAKLWTDSGAGYEETGTIDFCPYGELDADITKTETAIVLNNASDLDLVSVGSHCQIGTGATKELCRVDAVDAVTGDVTIARGVLDTVVWTHSAGDPVYFWDEYNGNDPTEYAVAETVNVKLTPQSGAGTVDISAATALPVTLDQRAFRAYPPGNLTIQTESYVDTLYTGSLDVAWAHRDRLLQTTGTLADHFASSIGPEAGTTYRLKLTVEGVVLFDDDTLTGTSNTPTPISDGRCKVELWTKRDSLYSIQAATTEFDFSFTPGRATEDAAFRQTESGAYRVTED